MSDSDDDWFDKEIDEFVVNVQPKAEAGDESFNPSNFAGGATQFFDSDYGGNYNKSYASTHSNAATSNSSRSNDADVKHIQAISYKKLSFILELAPLNVFLELIPSDSGFAETINRPTISYEVIALTLKAIACILQQPLIEHNRSFLKTIFDAKNYWKQIENYTKDLTSNQKSVKDQKKKLIISPSSELEFWEHLCLLCRHMVRHFKMDDTFFEKTIKSIVDSKHELKLKKFRDDLESIRASMSCKQLGKVPEIYPTLTELLSDTPVSVQPNLLMGRYAGVTEYLDVHLSLLREDFIGPLREGIALFRTQADAGLQQSNNMVRFYAKVRILTKQQKLTTRQHKGENLMVDLDPESRPTGDDGAPAPLSATSDLFPFNSKKLMYGSLLLFTSSAAFEDLILAVVSHREADMLAQGCVQIEILKTSNVSLMFEKDFLMFESEIFFEPYHQVYRVLSNLTEDSFPMKEYIINIDPTEHFPAYVPSALPKVVYTHRKHALDLKDTSRWPAAHLLNMNDSQMEAFRHTLTNQFSIIQGPPGTGKTHIGLEILIALLRNTDEQMLVICSTNHALDQFLVGVLNYTEDIVRMGQQSKNELLDRYNVKQLMENSVFEHRLKHCFYKTKCQYAELMQRFQDLQSKTESDIDRRAIEKKMLEIQKRQEELRQISEFNVLKTKRIIGMTSSCAARSSTLLRLLKTPIVFIEEAAELLESHIVAVLTKETQHLILIGDHQQLRPTTSVYKLAKLCHMDISLFERMINNDVHSTQMTVQHRMRPEIANLLRPHIYRQLVDHESVQNYLPVQGLQKNLFFVDHNHPESADRDEYSKQNPFEVYFLLALCNYLILQGYAPHDITVLTTYNGQMYLFAQERKKYSNLRNVRFTVVDNYQGEENKIVLLSLVRSNVDNKIGYLSLSNRVCVALSRAREGFYIIGDMGVLANNAKVWRDVRVELQRQRAIGPALALQCQTHQKVTEVSCAGDLDVFKKGGCREQCGKQLECGHQCSSVCHTNLFKHILNCGCLK